MIGALRRLANARSRVAIGIVAAGTIAVLVALVVLWPSSEAGPHVPFGFNNNAASEGVATPDDAAKMIAAAGGEIDRVQIDWASLEPSPGELRFEPYDAIYEADLRHGVRPLFIFAFAPPWATAAECAEEPVPCHAAPSPEHYADAARTAAAIAERYPRAAGIEIWNEPNTPHFWAPTPDPDAYSELLRACYLAIKRVAPSMPVLGGSTSSSPGYVAGHIRAPEFVRALAENGALDYMDALSLHAYPDPADPTGESAVAHVEDVRDALGEEKKPIWITETGVTTSGPDAVSEEVQALTLLRLAERLPEVSDVEVLLFHTLVEVARGASNPETGFGVVRADLQPKSAYCALGQALGGEVACES